MILGPMRDLQTEWEPVAVVRTLCRAPDPTSPDAWCACLGSTTPEAKAAGLCECDYARVFGVLDYRPALPPVRGCASPA